MVNNYNNISEEYGVLTERIKENLPLKAYPVPEFVEGFKKTGNQITLKTEMKIINVHNGGELIGILCTALLNNGLKISCSLTHLDFPTSTILYNEITAYQIKRIARVKIIMAAQHN